MIRKYQMSLWIIIVILMKVKKSGSEQWNRIRCSSDPEQWLQDGTLADIGRFPWLGVVQHSFYVGSVARFAITPGVLIHPAYAIAPAQDISKISHEQIANNTKFIVWYSRKIKYPIPVSDYMLHPEYESTLATMALLQLAVAGQTSATSNPSAVLPVCLPLSGAGTFSELYTVRMTDQNKILEKEVYKMKFVDDDECQNFYDRNQLSHTKMSPVGGVSVCAAAERRMPPCVWDGGAVLITRQNWGFWKIVGFSVRGAGCGAPARFLQIHAYLQWIDDVITQPEPGDEVYRIGVRRFSPVHIELYKASKIIPTSVGYCDKKKRGSILYKESFELTATKDFLQGYFYVVVSQIADFHCAVMSMEDVTYRSNTAMWIEHYCHREMTGLATGMKYPYEYKKQSCFMYFKSAAFIMFRFVFSFKTTIEMSLYGYERLPKYVPNPYNMDQTTDHWEPTDRIIKWDTFMPYYKWTWFL